MAGGDRDAEAGGGAPCAIVTLELAGDEHRVAVEPGESVFAAARRAGLRLPFSCVAGYCGECMGVLLEGRVEMKIDKALSEKQRGRGLVLTCQARPLTGSCRIRMGDLRATPPPGAGEDR